MKIQLKKTLSGQVQSSSEFQIKKLNLEGVELEDNLKYCLSKFTEGIIDPDISGRKPDGFIINMQKGMLGDFSKRYIVTAHKNSVDGNSNSSNSNCNYDNNDNSNINDEVIGILIGFPNEEHNLHIYSLHVSPDFRKRGVGSALLSKCINDMYQNNVKEIVLDVYRDNAPAYNLYSKFDFN